MKLEKFNLQDALNGRPVVTRDGNPVKIAGYNTDAEEASKLCGWSCGDGVAMQWHEDGVFSFNRDEDSEFDLFHPAEEKKPRTFWVNEYKKGAIGTTFFDNEKAAKYFSNDPDYITTHKIEIP